MDPHLACADINVWGAKMADAGDSYQVFGWEPSGTKGLAYSSNWHYDGTQGGDQVMDVINVQQLIANATANGDAPKNKNGFHFKIAVTQDPHKFKTFWVNCPPPSAGGNTGGSGQPGTTPGTTTGSTPSGGTQGTTQQGSGQAPQQAVLGTRVSGGHRAARRHHRARRRHKKRHRVVQRQAVLPAFTG